jgi:hypothetical protein
MLNGTRKIILAFQFYKIEVLFDELYGPNSIASLEDGLYHLTYIILPNYSNYSISIYIKSMNKSHQ